MKKNILLPVVMIIILSGCASRKEIVQFQTDITLIKNQLNALQSQNQKMQLELLNIERSIDQLSESQQRTKADLMSEMSAFKDEAVFLRNQLDDTGNRMSTLLHRVENVSQPDSLTGSDSLASANAQGNKDIQPATLYESAYRDLKQGHYDLALNGFQEYIRRYPKSNFTDNAVYWIGEIYYVNKDYERALQEFKNVVINYPRGQKVPASLLKTGYCYMILKRPDQAKMAFQKILLDYPGTQEAKLAETRLGELQ